MQAIGKPFTLWTSFAKFYERHNHLANARLIFEKATAVPFKYVDDLASVWCEYAEMELRHKNFKNALELLRRATDVPDTYDRKQVGIVPCHRVWKCVWLEVPSRHLPVGGF